MKKRIAEETLLYGEAGLPYDPIATMQHYEKMELSEVREDVRFAIEMRKIAEEEGLIRKQRNDKLDGNWMWITLRPADVHKSRFADFRELTEQVYLKRKMFLDAIWAWEQKGETIETLGTGYHVHILGLMRPGLMKVQTVKDTKSTFNKFFNGDVNDAFVQVDYVRTQEHLNNICAYMQGYKNDDWKDAACALDPSWRALKGLKALYGNEGILQG